ncbi:hypothetical protein KC320_g268 [Hortaea werneckii]|nr:hypothetical protein KC320_g268 [Hortaea werneckii]
METLYNLGLKVHNLHKKILSAHPCIALRLPCQRAPSDPRPVSEISSPLSERQGEGQIKEMKISSANGYNTASVSPSKFLSYKSKNPSTPPTPLGPSLLWGSCYSQL